MVTYVLALQTQKTGYWMLQSTAGGNRFISGFDANLASLNNTTELSYLTTGAAANRFFVVQWKNFGFNGSSALTVNFQVRLSETSNEINVVYGTTTLTGSSIFSLQLGLRGGNNGVYSKRSGTSLNWLSTTSGIASSTINYTTGQNPASGTTYTFIPPICTPSVQPTNLSFSLYTNQISASFTASVPAVNTLW